MPTPPVKINPSPNRLRAVFNHFPQLCCALIGLSVVVLVAVLDKDFQVKPYFSWQYISALNNRNVIATICLGAVFFFFQAVQKSFFSQGYNVADMTPLDRQWFFGMPDDPVNYYSDATHGTAWRTLVEAYLNLSKQFIGQAVIRLEIGTVLLFVSVSLLLISYAESFWIGVVSVLLVFAYVVVLVSDHKKRS
jgi:hypothetical protein